MLAVNHSRARTAEDLYDDHIVITGWYSDIQHELVFEELDDGACGIDSAFVYDESLDPGFVYPADRGTI